ncbi:metallopeptidase TldD-related protein [Nakamurella lactea]|uniref:metallopeptidase TldD-related protein n=1 Tax=Nakamurella lactea TaxID=459515 RepID=UPI00040C09D2|nr:metallopeptidase TldD-related protein [Nakamurella lactea]
MNVEQADVRRALDIFGGGTRLDIAAEDVGLLRFAGSRVTAQHAEHRMRVRIRIDRDGAVASGATETLESGAIQALSERLDEGLRAQRRTTAPGGAGAPSAPARPSSVAAARSSALPVGDQIVKAGAVERHSAFAIVRDGLGGQARLGGAVRHDVIERVVAGSSGLYRSELLTKVSLNAVAEQDGRSASVRLVSRDPDDLRVEGLADSLLAELEPLPVREAASGSYRVVLRPQAVITLLATFGHVSLGAAGYATGRTGVAGRMGQQLVSALLTLTDDGADSDGLPSGFDVEGTPRRRTPLIERGVLNGVVSNLEHAAVTDNRSTGHGVPVAWRFGADPSPSHLLLDPGNATEDELISECGRGLLVSKLDYLRVLHPKDTLVTGTTRDATFWIEGGRIVARHPQVRLTFRMDDVLRAVLAVGKQRERGEVVFMESVVAPGLLIDAGPFVL